MGEQGMRERLAGAARAAFTGLPPGVRRAVTRANRSRPGNRARWGTLRRTRPFGVYSGYDRGTPVDRPLIERFLDEHRAAVRGRVLEVKAPDYTRRYGGAAVTAEVVVDIDPSNASATVVADLCAPGSLEGVEVDCVILTQTLQFLADPGVALANLWGALAPGGTMLVTAPCVSGVDFWLDAHDLWRFTVHGLRALVERACPGGAVTAVPLGNVLLCVGYLYGLAAEEFDAAELAETDPRFALTVAAAVTKPAAA